MRIDDRKHLCRTSYRRFTSAAQWRNESDHNVVIHCERLLPRTCCIYAPIQPRLQGTESNGIVLLRRRWSCQHHASKEKRKRKNERQTRTIACRIEVRAARPSLKLKQACNARCTATQAGRKELHNPPTDLQRDLLSFLPSSSLNSGSPFPSGTERREYLSRSRVLGRFKFKFEVNGVLTGFERPERSSQSLSPLPRAGTFLFRPFHPPAPLSDRKSVWRPAPVAVFTPPPPSLPLQLSDLALLFQSALHTRASALLYSSYQRHATA